MALQRANAVISPLSPQPPAHSHRHCHTQPCSIPCTCISWRPTWPIPPHEVEVDTSQCLAPTGGMRAACSVVLAKHARLSLLHRCTRSCSPNTHATRPTDLLPCSSPNLEVDLGLAPAVRTPHASIIYAGGLTHAAAHSLQLDLCLIAQHIQQVIHLGRGPARLRRGPAARAYFWRFVSVSHACIPGTAPWQISHHAPQWRNSTWKRQFREIEFLFGEAGCVVFEELGVVVPGHNTATAQHGWHPLCRAWYLSFLHMLTALYGHAHPH